MYRCSRWSLWFVAAVLGASGCQPGGPAASPAPPGEQAAADAPESAQKDDSPPRSAADAPDQPSPPSRNSPLAAADSEEIIKLTPRAAEAIRARIAAEPRKDKLRVSIVKEFAGPMRWSASLVAAPDPFDDEVFTSQGITIVVDRGTRPHIAGTTIDYVAEGPDKGLQFKNPRLEEAR